MKNLQMSVKKKYLDITNMHKTQESFKRPVYCQSSRLRSKRSALWHEVLGKQRRMNQTSDYKGTEIVVSKRCQNYLEIKRCQTTSATTQRSSKIQILQDFTGSLDLPSAAALQLHRGQHTGLQHSCSTCCLDVPKELHWKALRTCRRSQKMKNES